MRNAHCEARETKCHPTHSSDVATGTDRAEKTLVHPADSGNLGVKRQVAWVMWVQ